MGEITAITVMIGLALGIRLIDHRALRHCLME
jgi:hypothetical protein